MTNSKHFQFCARSGKEIGRIHDIYVPKHGACETACKQMFGHESNYQWTSMDRVHSHGVEYQIANISAGEDRLDQFREDIRFIYVDKEGSPCNLRIIKIVVEEEDFYKVSLKPAGLNQVRMYPSIEGHPHPVIRERALEAGGKLVGVRVETRYIFL